MLYHEVAQRLEKRLGLNFLPLFAGVCSGCNGWLNPKGMDRCRSLPLWFRRPRARRLERRHVLLLGGRTPYLEEAGWPIGPESSPNQTQEQARQLAATVGKVAVPVQEGAL